MQRAIMTEVGQVRGWSHPDFFFPFDRVTIRPSIRHARSLKLVWQPLTRFQSLPLCLSLLGARNEHARVDRASEEFSKKIFFFFLSFNARVFFVSLRFQFAISLPMQRVTNNYLGDHVWTWCHRPSVSCANAEPIEFHAAISSVPLTWPPTLPRLRHESTYVFTHRALVSTLFLFLLSFSLPPPLF